jgi:hypothetical protein
MVSSTTEEKQVIMVQATYEPKDHAEGADVLSALALQEGYKAGKLWEASAGKPLRLQAFLEAPEGIQSHQIADLNKFLPDGLRYVIMTKGIMKAMGIGD